MLKRFALLCALLCALAVVACGGSTPRQSAGGSVHPPGWGGTPKGYVLPAPLFTAVPTTTMWDAVTTGNIPAHPFAAAGYTAGNFITWPTIERIAKHAVSIAIQANFHADCLDVEPGDAVPSQAGPWVLADIRAGFHRPCVYSDLSEMPQVKASLAASLGPNWRGRVLLWLAWYRNIPGLVAGYDAVQYWDHCLGLSLDCSTVTLAFLEIAQPPYVPPRPHPAPPPKPPVTRAHAFNAGFQRAFIVGYDRRHRRTVPQWHGMLPARGHLLDAFDQGYQDGFRAGWKG